MSAGPAPRLRLRLSPKAEASIRRGHPWVYGDSVREQNRPGEAGELAVLFDRNDKFLAVGLFDPESPLRVRVLHRGKPAQIDQGWWRESLRQAAAKRKEVFTSGTTGGRWINGESDGWPGLVLDQYADTFVLKIYTAAWPRHFPAILPLIQEQFSPARIVLRLSRNIQGRFSSSFKDGQVIHGPPLDGSVVFEENGILFEADVLKGQKTGFFLDQRENRRRIETLAAGRTVLNAFSFSGGFSLYAARGGARCVTDVDISAHALASAQRNFDLNKTIPAVVRCQRIAVQADVFEWLAGATEKYDLIVLDPPSLAKREVERARALEAYARLAATGAALLRPGGVLVCASCSAHVSADEFFQRVRSATRPHQLLQIETSRHPIDHPATFPEAEYLKTIYLQRS